MRKAIYFVVFCGILSAHTRGLIITVDDDNPADFSTIQEAIDYSWHGDTIIVMPGFYREDIFYGGRAITIQSSDPENEDVVESTIINGTVHFSLAELSISKIIGFTVKSDSPGNFHLCKEIKHQKNPAISDKYIVWDDQRNSSNVDIYGKNLTTGAEFIVCSESGRQTNPSIYNDIVVWMDYRNGNGDIYGKNLTTGEEFEVCTNEAGQYNPDIYENIVVWSDYRLDHDGDIFGNNLSTGQEFIICDQSDTQQHPAINGIIVVWKDWRNSDADIYGKNLTTGEEFAVCIESNEQTDPDVHGNIIVWQDYRKGHEYDIYAFDILRGEEFAVCTAGDNQEDPSIFNDTVVWVDERDTYDKLRGKNLLTLQEFIVSDDSSVYDLNNPFIYEDMVVWDRYRDSATDYDIYQTIITHQNPISYSHGIYCINSSPTIEKCRIIGFSYGIFNDQFSSPTIKNNTIEYCVYGGVNGGSGIIEGNTIRFNRYRGIYNFEGSILSNQIFGNYTDGIATTEYSPSIIAHNVISYNGGDGISNCDSSCDINNNTFINNANYGVDSCQGIIKNNIFFYDHLVGSNNNLYNCFWPNVSEGFIAGIGSIIVDPLFVDTFNGVYHIKSEYGRWDTTTQQWVYDNVTSRCIDAGDPADGIGLEMNPNGGRINVGAYGGTSTASKSATEGEEHCINPPAYDTNDDCIINMLDISAIFSEWLNCGFADPNDC